MLLNYLTIGNISLTALWLITVALLLLLFVKYRRVQANQVAPAAVQQPVQSAPQAEPQKMGLNLNMLIANSHQFTTQLIGMQLSSANALALAVSATSVVAGTVSVAVIFYPGGYPLWLVAGAVGAGLAILIEGLTLGALIRIRLANKSIKGITEKLDKERDERLEKIIPPAQQADLKVYKAEVQVYRQAVKLVEQEAKRKKHYAVWQYASRRNTSCLIAGFGAIASATAGGLFYHTLLSNLVWYASYGISALFALVVTGTFISSELFKDEQQQAIREGFEGGALAETAIKQETIRLAHQGVYLESVQFLQSSEAQQMIRAGFKEVLKDVILEMRVQNEEQIVATVFEEKDQANRETIAQQTPALSAPISATQNATEEEVEEQESDPDEESLSATESLIDEEQDESEHTTDPVLVAAPKFDSSCAPESAPKDTGNITFLHSSQERKDAPRSAPKNGRGTAASKAVKIIKRKPDITAPELADRAGITPSYARKILAKQGEQKEEKANA